MNWYAHDRLGKVEWDGSLFETMKTWIAGM